MGERHGCLPHFFGFKVNYLLTFTDNMYTIIISNGYLGGIAMARKVNITISEELIQAYQELADEMGIPRSAAMVMGMKTYIDQQKSLKMGDIYKQLEELAKQVSNTK